MAYTVPRTWVAGDVLTAAQLNQDVRDNQLAAFPESLAGISAAMTTWSPVFTQSVVPTKTTTNAKYFRIGRFVICWWAVTFTSAGTASNQIVMSGLPVAASIASAIQGTFKYFDAGNTVRAGHCNGTSTTSALFYYDGFGNPMGLGDFAIANTDTCEGVLFYEAAT